ncbi:MAG: DUF1730 domain-containing protein [Bacteroidetes bacterium]|nr:DUF1730 domain-containing protein [Bacteroidota bacterium]
MVNSTIKISEEREGVLKNWLLRRNERREWVICQVDIEKRINPEFLVPEQKSTRIVTGLSYYTDKQQTEPGVPILSRYAFGENYHDVIKRKLDKLFLYIKSIKPETIGRAFVDSSPLLEKAWAVEAGLGWQGRHSIVNK